MTERLETLLKRERLHLLTSMGCAGMSGSVSSSYGEELEELDVDIERLEKYRREV